VLGEERSVGRGVGLNSFDGALIWAWHSTPITASQPSGSKPRCAERDDDDDDFGKGTADEGEQLKHRREAVKLPVRIGSLGGEADPSVRLRISKT
jgi:hypothetical protein